MILGASHGAILEALWIFLLGIGAGGLAIVLFIVRCGTKSAVLRFIYDFCYAIIVAGVFVVAMLHINSLDCEYYHIMALMIGIALAYGVPMHYLARYRERIERYFEQLYARIRHSRVANIIKK